MAKQNAIGSNYTNNSDGWDMSGGTTARKITVTSGDITLTGGGAAVITFPASTSTLATLGLAQTFTAVQTISNDIKVSTAGKGLFIKEGSNAKMGIATLVGGTVTISTTAVSTTSRIFLTIEGGTLTNVGFSYVSARTNATSFVITSSNVLDTSDVAWIIIDPA